MTEKSESDAEPLKPPANPDLFGHDAAEATLLRALQSGRLPHAWLITGPRGIGKATLAFRFARFLLVTKIIYLRLMICFWLSLELSQKITKIELKKSFF